MSAALATLPPPPPIAAPYRMSITATDPLAFDHHWKQARYDYSPKRFNVVPAGRRSGKTHIAKRRGCREALTNVLWPDYRIAYTAPTYAQVKRIYWDDLHRILTDIDKDIIKDSSKTELRIQLVNDSEIWLIGMDKPDRFEGPSWNRVYMDEAANTKSEAIEQHVMPALSERLGGLDLYGVPEGRNHYYKTANFAQELENAAEWAYHHWTSLEVMPIYLGVEAAEREIARARRRMDELTFKQEYEADFIHFLGQAYYCFDRSIHAIQRLAYDPFAPLHLAFDFNVDPGIAIVLQEKREQRTEGPREDCTLAIGEVTIRKASTTDRVCKRLINDWGSHKGLVYCYGDATGGARGSAKVRGSDWEIVKAFLRPHFKERLRFRVQKKNWAERVRINSVNSRFLSATGDVRFLIDPVNCPELAIDFDEVQTVKGGSGEIDKSDGDRTHHTDGAGYYITRRFPMGGGYKVENKQI
jgi:hypothetical protein